jgi:hypothetical protein
LSYLVPFTASSRNKKGYKCELAASLNESKGFTRATNAALSLHISAAAYTRICEEEAFRVTTAGALGAAKRAGEAGSMI